LVLEKIFKWPRPILHFWNYLPFEKDLAIHFKNLEFPLPKDDLYQVWLKLACWFWRRRFLKMFSVFLLFCYYIPPWRRDIPLLWTTLNPLHPRMICVKCGTNWSSGSGEEVKKCKSIQTDRQTDGQTSDGRRTSGDQKSSLELSAQVS
jgi:hypothetical protein